jgi:enamine deaminase RidA (YjgF/YER057c/UK114 family)
MAQPSKPADKTVKQLGMPWEKTYGYAQAVQVKDVIYVSGQLSHDDQGNLVGSAPIDASGRIIDASRLAFPQQLVEISFTAVLPG